MNQARVHIGVDVGKECLDICYPDGSREHIGNTKRSRAKLIRKARAASAIVSFEATGPYEENLADECLAAGVPAVRLDAWKTRKYAESQGMLEKTDAIDCEMIRDFAASLKPEQLRFVRPVSDGYRRLKRATSVRRNLIKAKALVVNQLENILDREVWASVSRAIDALERQIEKMDALCAEAIGSDEKMNALAVRFEQVVGVGPVLISTMLSSCPDIGSFTSKGIAKMAGVAPIENKSCTIRKKSRPRRGRRELRSALYMAAVSACHSNHLLEPIYKRFVDRGMPRRVALIALARHIAILMNYIAKYPDFNPAVDPKKSALPALPRRKPGRPRKNP